MDTWAKRPVLAAIDHSRESMLAAGAAAAEADRRRLPLRLVCCRHNHPPAHHPATRPVRRPAGNAQEIIAQAVQLVRVRFPALDVSTDTPPGDLADVLVEQSSDATLVVVGPQHTGGYDRLFDRWLSNRVVTHSQCPVLVVRTAADPTAAGVGHRPVLVGVDGSEHSAAAVPLAFEEAMLRGAPLWAVNIHCVDPHATFDVPDDVGYTAAVAQAWAADLIAAAVAGWTNKYPQVKVIAEPRYASEVAAALVAASASAELVVVGARGRTARTSLLLGSASRTLVRHALCPVLVTHGCAGGGRSGPSSSDGAAVGSRTVFSRAGRLSRSTVVALPPPPPVEVRYPRARQALGPTVSSPGTRDSTATPRYAEDS
jgi:nucleotide-binding universal stress UspA family protein